MPEDDGGAERLLYDVSEHGTFICTETFDTI